MRLALGQQVSAVGGLINAGVVYVKGAYVPLALAALMFGIVAQKADATTLRLAASTPLSSYADPLAIDTGNGIIAAVFDALTVVERGKLKPALAISWENTSPTTWTFRLRPDVVFSDGTPFDADVAVSFFEFIISSDAFVYPVAVEAQTIAGISKVDDLTIEIKTHRPDAVLPRRLSKLPVLPMSIWAEVGRTEFSKNPIGTGSYRVGSWSGGGSGGVVLTAVEQSWRPPKQIEKVEYIILTDPTTRLQSLLSDAVDIANAIDVDAIPVVEDAGLVVHAQVGPIILAITFYNCGVEPTPMKDVRVRRALALAVNKNQMVESLMAGVTKVATQGGMPGVVGYNPDIAPYPFDPDAARALLREAAYPPDRKLVVGVFTGQFPSDALIFQQVAQDWRNAGVDAEFRRIPFPEYSRRLLSGDWADFDAISTVWSHYELGDVSRALQRYVGAHPTPYFCVPDLIEDLANSDAEMDEALRDQKLQTLMSDLHDLVPSLPLIQYVSINALGPRVVDFQSRIGAIQFEQMHIAID